MGHYFATRAVDDQEMVGLRGLQDSVLLQPGDRVDVEGDIATWNGLKAFEVIDATENPDGTRDFTLQEYDAAAFIDTAEPVQLIVGGVIVGPSTLPAGNVSAPSLSENPFVSPIDGKVFSRLTGSWTNPSPLGTFAGVELWGRLLDDVSAPIEERRFLHKANEAPFAFILDREPTGEELEVQFRSFNLAGRVNPAGPTLTELLDGLASAPAAVADLWRRQIPGGLQVSWREGLEINLVRYGIYDCGSVAPANDAEITEAQRINATLPANPGAAALVIHDYLEREYTGGSDGTVVTLETDVTAVLFKAGAHVIGSTGKTVTFFADDGSESQHQVVSNTERTITFAAASIPSGAARLRLRGADGVYNLYVRAENSTGQQSAARPVPPATLPCFPFARDGTADIGTAVVQAHPAFFGAIFFCGRPGLAGDGFFSVSPAAKGFGADRQSINGIIGWCARVSYYDLVIDKAKLNLIVEDFDAAVAIDSGVYTQIPALPDWIRTNGALRWRLPNVEISRVDLAAVNSWRTGEFKQIPYFQLQTGPYLTGSETASLISAVSASVTTAFDYAVAPVHEILLDQDIAEPSVPGAKAGLIKILLLVQDATGGRNVTQWPAGWRGLGGSAAPYRIAQEPNAYTSIQLFFDSSTTAYLLATPVKGGVAP